LPNHFLHFNKLLGKRVPKLLVTYGKPNDNTSHSKHMSPKQLTNVVGNLSCVIEKFANLAK
jgi:hypothetical protein